MIFAVLQNGVQLLGINQFWLQAVVGAAILVTVFFYSIAGAPRRAGAARVATAAPAAQAVGRRDGGDGNEWLASIARALGGFPPRSS